MANIEPIRPGAQALDDKLERLIDAYHRDVQLIVQSFKDGPPEPPTTYEPARHPWLYVDLYLFVASTIAMLTITTSLIDRYMFEPLVYTAIGLNILGLLCLQTRNLGFRDHAPPSEAQRGRLRELQLKHGVKPLDRK